mmetsp:Transcript_21226/g.41520  ORF Transcript_21226/g.41520 Transcript_21226/m.41520 type:complete len:503 (+) Transcript_21226:48-1556(+)
MHWFWQIAIVAFVQGALGERDENKNLVVSDQKEKQVRKHEHQVAAGAGALARFSLLKLPLHRDASSASVMAEVISATRHGRWTKLTESSYSDQLKTELNIFKQETAVKSHWQHTMQVYEGRGTAAHKVLEQYRDKQVPGLDATFREVFNAIHQEGNCHLWLIGGSVRDLLAGLPPNDFDCMALCVSGDLSNIVSVAENHSWAHEVSFGDIFTIGTKESDNYLEGFPAQHMFTNHLVPEFTTSILLWALSTDNIIDPTGTGLSDAENKLLRPAAPLDHGTSVTNSALWERRQEWLRNGLTQLPWAARHVRYLKMRMRGWKPADDCVRLFMANTLDAMVWVEQSSSNTEAFGQTWPWAPKATVSYLQMTFARKSEADWLNVLDNLLAVLKEDLEPYFKGSLDDKCSGFQPPLVRDAVPPIGTDNEPICWWERLGPLCWFEVFKNGIVKQCADMVNGELGKKKGMLKYVIDQKDRVLRGKMSTVEINGCLNNATRMRRQRPRACS